MLFLPFQQTMFYLIIFPLTHQRKGRKKVLFQIYLHTYVLFLLPTRSCSLTYKAIPRCAADSSLWQATWKSHRMRPAVCHAACSSWWSAGTPSQRRISKRAGTPTGTVPRGTGRGLSLLKKSKLKIEYFSHRNYFVGKGN